MDKLYDVSPYIVGAVAGIYIYHVNTVKMPLNKMIGINFGMGFAYGSLNMLFNEWSDYSKFRRRELLKEKYHLEKSKNYNISENIKQVEKSEE